MEGKSRAFFDYKQSERRLGGLTEPVQKWRKDGKPRCLASVRGDMFSGGHQCNRQAKHDALTRCWMHSDEKRDAEFAAWRKKHNARMAKVDYQNALADYRKECAEAVRLIALGHNDPAGLCRELMEKEPQPQEPEETENG